MSALQAFVDTTVVTAFQLTQRDPVFAYKPTDQTVNNSAVIVSDSALSWSLAANATYEYTIRVLFNSNTTANLKFDFTFPAAARMDFGINGLAIGGGGDPADNAFPNYASGTVLAVQGGTIDLTLLISGTITMGVNAGTVQFQWAQNTANASNTIVRGGSSGTFRQVA